MILVYIALFGWILLALALFATRRPPVAAALTFVGGSMFLPCAIDINPPILPPLGKEEFASLSVLLAGFLYARPALRRARLGRGPEILVGVAMASAVVSVLNNMDEVRVGLFRLRATTPLDFVADSIWLALRWGVPFFVGRAFFRRSADVRWLFALMAAAGLGYSLLILLELQISPQLHRFVYGYHQHAFYQTVRDGGFRPMVFMVHGLNLTLFVVMCMASALALARMRLRVFRLPALVVGLYLGAIVVACKSTGSVIYAAFLLPLLLLAPARVQVWVAAALAAGVLAYPLLRNTDVLPMEEAVELAGEAWGPRRASSLASRFETEREILARIHERPWFGWSNTGRSALHDPETGQMETIYDGFWIILMASRGVVGYLAVFGLLLYPILPAVRAMPRIRAPADRVTVGALCLMVVVNVFDLLPNSTVEGYLTLLSGALSGVVPGILAEQRGRRARDRAAARPAGPPARPSERPSARPKGGSPP